MIADKNWKGMRKWVGQNSDNDFDTLYRKVFNALEQRLEPSSVPQFFLLQTINTSLLLQWIQKLISLHV